MLAGADKVSINSAAVRDPAIVGRAAEKFGSQAIVVAIDAKRVSAEGETPRWNIFTHGGATTPASMRWISRARSSISAQARSCSPRWTGMAPRPASTSP